MAVEGRIKVIAENLTSAVMEQVRAELDKTGDAGARASKKIADGTKDASGSFSDLLGKAAPLAGAFGIAFGAVEVVNFGKAILDDADALTRMSDVTGITITGLQRFKVVGDGAGNSVEQLAAASVKLSDNIAGGNDSALGALNRLGVSVDDLKTKAPEDQFIAISDAIRQIKDPQEQITLAIDLFGKTGAEVLPSLKAGFDDVKGAVVGMSEETVRALDEAGDMLTTWSTKAKGLAAEFLVAAAHAVSDAAHGLSSVDGELARQAAREEEVLKAKIERLKAAALAQLELTQEVKGFVGPVADAKLEAEVYARQLKAQEEASRKAAAATKAHREEKEKLHTALIRAEHALELNANQIGIVDDVTIPMLKKFTTFRSTLQEIEHPQRELLFGLKTMNAELVGVGQAADIVGPKLEEAFVGPLQDVVMLNDAIGNIKRDIAGGLGNAILGALQGGGNVGKSAGGFLGQSVAKGILGEAGSGGMADFLTKNLGKTLGGALGSVLPGLGTLIGSGIGGLISKGIAALANIGGPSKAELEGRKIVESFENEVTKLLTTQQRAEAGGEKWREIVIGVRDAYLKIGLSAEQAERDVKRLWESSRDGGEGSADVVAELKKNLDAATEATKKQADEAVAAEDRVKAARTAANSLASRELEGLYNKRKSLVDSIAGEAPEEVAGVIETQVRGQIDALDREISSQQSTMEERAKSIAAELEAALSNVKPADINQTINRYIRDHYETPDAPRVSFANEGFDIARPTRAVVGDNPFESESVLRESTVKQIALAAKRSGPGDGLGELKREIMRLGDRLERQSDAFRYAVEGLPVQMRHAMRGVF